MGWVFCMVLAVIAGVVCGIWASGSWSDRRQGSSMLGWGVGIVAAVLLCVLVSMAFGVRVIKPGEAGVRMAFGSFAGDPLPNGLHIVAPWVQVIKYDTKMLEYTMDHNTSDGQVQGNDAISVLCKDRLQMEIDCTVFYAPKVDKLNWIHGNLGKDYMKSYLRPLVRKIVPQVFGSFDSMEVSTSGRQLACTKAEEMLAPEFEKLGITLHEVNLRHIQPPADVLAAIAAKVAAQENAKKAEIEGQGMVAKARGEAQANAMKKVALTPMLLKWMKGIW